MKIRSRFVAPLLVGIILLAATGIVGCTNADVVARVNGEPIKLSAMQEQFDQMKKSSPQTFTGADAKAREAEFKAKILESLIQLELVKQEAKRLKVEPTDKQVNDYLTQLQTQYGGKKGLDDAMKQSGVTQDQLKSSVQSRLMVDAVTKKIAKETVPSNDEVKAYYDANTAMFLQPAQVHAAHVLVATKDKAIAQDIFAQAQKGGDFKVLAKQFSIDPASKDKAGDLGWAPASRYVAEFSKAVTEMKPNEVRLVQTQFGWHIIKLLENKAPVQRTLDQVKAQINATLSQRGGTDQFTAYIDKLRGKAEVEIFDAALKKAVEAASKPATSTAPAK